MAHLENHRKRVLVFTSDGDTGEHKPPIGTSDLVRIAFFEAMLHSAIGSTNHRVTVASEADFEQYRNSAANCLSPSIDLSHEVNHNASAMVGSIRFSEFLRVCVESGDFRRPQESLFAWYNYRAHLTKSGVTVWNAYLEVSANKKLARCYVRPTFAARSPKAILSIVHHLFRKGYTKWLFQHFYGTHTLDIVVSEVLLRCRGWRRVAGVGKGDEVGKGDGRNAI